MHGGGDRSDEARRPDRKKAALVIQWRNDEDTVGSGCKKLVG